MKANSKKLYAYLTDRGYDHEEAERLSVTRIFGPREGEYGTGITSIIETKAWEKEEQIGSRFLSSLHYAYNRNHAVILSEEIKNWKNYIPCLRKTVMFFFTESPASEKVNLPKPTQSGT